VIFLNWTLAVFLLNFSLLLLHEMDAIRAKEWKMFVILKDMKEQTAYFVFSLLHLPLYFWIIYSITQTSSGKHNYIFLVTDAFLIFHSVIHFFFRKHKANEFKSFYSKALIYLMGILAMIHLVLYF